MFCPKCNTPLPENSNQCGKCGFSTPATTKAAVAGDPALKAVATGTAADGSATAHDATRPRKLGRMAPWLSVPLLGVLIWWARTAVLANPKVPSPQMFWAQFCLMMIAILLGIRRGGVSLGMIGGLGTAVLVLGFRAAPSEPPIQVMLIIIAVVTASATLQVAGGLDYMVQLTERLLRAHPKHVTLLAPFCCFLLTVCLGTGHGVYALLPVIADVALRTGIRPERPMAVSAIASQMGNTASPVAGVVTTFLAFSARTSHPVSLIDILKITVPAGIIGLLAAALWSLNRGKDLDQDPEFQKRMADPDFRKTLDVSVTTLGKKISRQAKTSVLLFFTGVAATVLLALDQDLLHLGLLPKIGNSSIPLTVVVQMVMLAFGAFILLTTDVKAAEIARSSVFIAGMIAVVSIFGIAWMSDTFVTGNKAYLVAEMRSMVQTWPWTFAISLFCVSAFVKSQTATMSVMFPFGVALGLPTTVMLGLMPATYAYFFFCFYPSDLAAINMDPTGTTHIGKYFFNHSFMVPGLIGVSVATAAAYLLSRVLL